MKRLVYTIESGFIQEDNEKYCTNETCYLTKEDYLKGVEETISRYIGNNTAKGFYIECYADMEEITDNDIQLIKDYKCMNDCSTKSNMIQQFIIDNSGEIIDYVYNSNEEHKINIREDLIIEINNELNVVDFNNEEEQDNSYNLIKEQIEIDFRQKAPNDYSLSFDDIIVLMNILENDDKSLASVYCEMLDFLNRDEVGCVKLRNKLGGENE